MAKANRKGRTNKAPKHVRLHHWMLKSTAYCSLGLAARCLLVEIYDLYDGTNNGELFLSIRDAAKRLGVGKNTAHSAFGELENRGFIRARERGLFTTKKATLWILTEFGHANQIPTKDFMRWEPEAQSRKKQNIVPERGTIGPCERDQGSRNAHENTLHGPCQGDRKAEKDGSLVPARGTQLVNQERGAGAPSQSGARLPDTEEAPKRIGELVGQFSGVKESAA